MGRHSQRKGKNFEINVARIIADALHVWAVRNLHQRGENAGRDLWMGLPFCAQCQHAQQVDISKKLAEAKGAARPEEMPIAITRKDYKPIIVSMEIDDWLELVKRALPWIGR